MSLDDDLTRYVWKHEPDARVRPGHGGCPVGREHVARQRCLLQIQRGHPVARVVNGEVYMVRALGDRLYLVTGDVIFPWLW